ncbi:MAG: TldD/PmbA family protein, partial [Oligoflexia bacterium]|nr:TldD/PmbA family protein [Oligoflexia bacterium]
MPGGRSSSTLPSCASPVCSTERSRAILPPHLAAPSCRSILGPSPGGHLPPSFVSSQTLAARFADAVPAVDFCSLRFVDERTETLGVRNDIVEPVEERIDRGAMITVRHGRGLGYAATSDLSASGLRAAALRARDWAARTAATSVFDFSQVPSTCPRGEHRTPVAKPWSSLSLSDKLDLLRIEVAAMAGDRDDRIVERTASLLRVSSDSLYLTADGGEIAQQMEFLSPDAMVIAHAEGVTQRRGSGSRGLSRQGGLEVLDLVGFPGIGARLRDQALQLLAAPDCPSGRRDLILAPDQMMLQLHESIGHPLELDRILGDERNYAGTSFVTPEMFGSYQYGSALLNVSFDPDLPGELASYAFDDDGIRAAKTFLIQDGVLLRPLGGATSQARAGLPGVANSRACSWNRPPIDRMANLNIEPGESSLDQLVAQVEQGIYMETNASWSIDDSRNKFQFGCEWARLIEDGRLGAVVRNPNYRGISATFWRNLAGVGNAGTVQILGTPYCGKGEPN